MDTPIKRTNYVRNKTSTEKTLASRKVSASKMEHFSAAYRHALNGLWYTDAYQFHRAKGFTASSYSDYLVGMVATGYLRELSLSDPALGDTCKQLTIPRTYKAILNYLKSGPQESA